VFVGRLSEEKGIDTLLAAWKELAGLVPLKVVGDGPLRPLVAQAAASNDAIQYLGAQPSDVVDSLLGEARFLVLPSQCYETFGRVTVEAFARGTPVIASRLGAMAEVVDDGRTGLHFEPGNPSDLAAQVRRFLGNPRELERMRQAAREEYVMKYTAETTYRTLMGIYEQALSPSASRYALPVC
jgi:glycosyltransferase involved in cell wall biosynthesis